MTTNLLREWLGLPPGPWPPDDATLLGFDPDAVDPTRVEAQALDRMARLRPHQLTQPDLVTEGMNRLAQAMVRLSSARPAGGPHSAYQVVNFGPSSETDPPPSRATVVPAKAERPIAARGRGHRHGGNDTSGRFAAASSETSRSNFGHADRDAYFASWSTSRLSGAGTPPTISASLDISGQRGREPEDGRGRAVRGLGVGRCDRPVPASIAGSRRPVRPAFFPGKSGVVRSAPARAVGRVSVDDPRPAVRTRGRLAGRPSVDRRSDGGHPRPPATVGLGAAYARPGDVPDRVGGPEPGMDTGRCDRPPLRDRGNPDDRRQSRRMTGRPNCLTLTYANLRLKHRVSTGCRNHPRRGLLL